MSDEKRPNWLEHYDIYDSVEVLKEKSGQWNTPALIVHDFDEVHTNDKDVMDAWENIFKFRTKMGITPRSGTKKPIKYRVRRYYDSKIVHDQASVIIRTFKKYQCTQKEVSQRTGISRGVISWICQEVPEAYQAYVEAKRFHTIEIHRQWMRKKRAEARG